MMRALLLTCWLCFCAGAQVRYEDVLKGPAADWLTYAGNYKGWRHSPLKQITVENAASMTPKWVYHVPNAKGLLLLASDGNKDLQPNDVWVLVSRVLQKKHGGGRTNNVQHVCVDGCGGMCPAKRGLATRIGTLKLLPYITGATRNWNRNSRFPKTPTPALFNLKLKAQISFNLTQMAILF